jgi:cation diffusion facilitator CzcD-associated flavoprotein CzcO
MKPLDAIVIGTGFAGIGMGIKLKQAGFDDFVLLEKDDDLGGTWRDNTYPGCACDVPSYLYSYSFEPNPDWTQMFAPQQEIWEYTRHCADKYGITPHIRYRSAVISARFDEDAALWTVETSAGDTYTARALISGVGALHVPRIPDIPGLDSFTGTWFHSAHWNHQHELAGRRVAVVGTGASAIQFVTQIQPIVGHLDVYQRTAAWITPKPDRKIPAKERRLHRRFPLFQKAIRGLVYWGLEARGAGFALDPRIMSMLEKSARKHLDRQVRDRQSREALTPHYQIGCKRILISDDFYPAVQQPNVELVTDQIAEIRPHGVVTADGLERPAETIIFGTGFDVSGNLMHLKVVGRDGRELSETWEREGISANLGISVAGFPNLFLLVGPNTGLGHTSMIFMIERQADYVIDALQQMRRRNAASIEVRAAAQRAFADRVQTKLSGTVWQSGCQSWYIDPSGRNSTIWPYFAFKYWLETRRVKTRDYEFSRP